jgi:hypothetical protein
MNHSARLLIAATLIFAAGCAAKQDWIDRTLVTVDVTGTWYGYTGGGSGTMGSGADFRLELEQHGSTVKGFLRSAWFGNSGRFADGPIEGTVAGDVFRFRGTRGEVEGELTVSGDEMTGVGMMSFWGQRRLSLRRTDPSSPPASPPR